MAARKSLPRKAILIVNTRSRQGGQVFDEAVRLLEAAGIDLLETHAVTDPRRLKAAVRRAVGTAPMVIVGGGDGTLSSTIDFFKDQKTVFALLPLGTANSFARALGIPLDLAGAIEVIARGKPRQIDLGCIDGDYFLNAAAIGLAPKVAESVPHGLKRTLGRLGYLVWAGWSAANFRAFRVKLEDGSRTARMWATEVRIANGRYHGGIELIENADLRSGEIVVQIVTGRSIAKLGWSYLAAAARLGTRRQAVREFVGSSFTLSTRPRMRVLIDGEVGAETPFQISALPDAVTIAAPRD